MSEYICSEKLFLHKGEKDIFVNNYKHLAAHQINGIRFLYSQFAKKTPGVIFNDPSGSGKTLQVVHFLNAVRDSLVNNPVLILCHDKDTSNWKVHLDRYTDFNEEITQSTKPYEKKLVVLNNFDNIYLFSSKKWGIIVIDDNSILKDLPKTKLSADLIIWMTNIDMKENLNQFSIIYKWMYPKTALDIKEFTSNKQSVIETVKKARLFLKFTEDILIRRNDGKIFLKQVNDQAYSNTEVTILRKNKDPTGTRTKRSKENCKTKPSAAFSTANELQPVILTSDDEDVVVKRKRYGSKIAVISDENESQLIKFQHEARSAGYIKSMELDKDELESELLAKNNDEVNIHNDSNISNEISDVGTTYTDTKISTFSKIEHIQKEYSSKSSYNVLCDGGDTNKIESHCLEIEESNENKHKMMNNEINHEIVKVINSTNIGIDMLANNLEKKNDKEEKSQNCDTKHAQINNELSNSLQCDEIKINRSTKTDKSFNNGDGSKNSVDKCKKGQDIEGQLSDLEIKIMNKFKGSLLDSIF